MSKRLKVLLSAYACEPGKGSEPEVGWQWALQMARFHDVTVVTRENNRQLVEPALDALRGKQPLPAFVYHDRGPGLIEFKRRFQAVRPYYLLWQKSARELIEQLQTVHQFDLMHHVTFATYRYPTAIWGQGAPCIWGPIGGMESIPQPLLPWHHPASLLNEVIRNTHNLLQATPFHVLPRRARASTLILASTFEMQHVFARLGVEAEVMPTIGLRTAELPFRPHRASAGPLKLLFVGNIITLKGIDLGLEALKRSDTDATLTLVGSGNYLEAARAQAAELGLQSRVNFLGRLPREQVLRLYPDYDAFLFPSLHDSGGYAAIEAMFNELPVICLDCGGPAVAVQAGSGIKVPLGKRHEVIDGLAAAMRQYSRDRSLLLQHGQAARRAILDRYDWDRKGVEMNERYQEAVTRFRNAPGNTRRQAFSGMGSVTNLLHGFLSLRGMAVSALGLLLIGAVGFLSVGRLKGEADAIVKDTLPSLTYAGEANVNGSASFNRTLMMLLADNPEQRATLRKEILNYSKQTTAFLESYKAERFTPAERALFDRSQVCRQAYLECRDRVFGLMDEQQRPEAISLCEQELLPDYLKYKQAMYDLFEFNVKEGKERGRTMLTVCTLTQWTAAAIGVLVFVLGFLIGMFK